MDNIEYVNSMGFLNLTEEQLEEYPISALEGDSLKASFLFDYYSLHNDDYEEGIYWTMIGAESGDKILEYNFAYILKDIYEDELRALFFFTKSAEKGSEAAGKALIQLQNDFNKRGYIFPKEKDLPLEINKNNVKLFSDIAKLGSQKAAKKLVEYYKRETSLCNRDKKIDRIEDEKSFIYWLRIGAQNNSKECMIEYATLLKQSSDKLDNIRSKFWIKKASK